MPIETLEATAVRTI